MEAVKTGLRLVVEKGDLERALSVCLRCVPSKPTISQLGGVLVRGRFQEGESPVVTATDLDAQVVAGLRARLEGEGELWLPARETFDLVRRLPECTLEVGQAERSTLPWTATAKSRFAWPLGSAGTAAA
ncbi:hypothetical protein [Ammonifex thiophilus]|uniref:DNA polymerase III beta sliding clamp N-terminal domain-containing protein n=1 Tax=Ammonifex thiophilus TaxID=444093 RepID=A0A3D8P5W6_9THEO|nr:hypothetical protein [Ammonifex thiophilus]RDV83916.1 hypothetical protein DXX99_03515 [Ammonifex thiophilus]